MNHAQHHARQVQFSVGLEVSKKKKILFVDLLSVVFYACIVVSNLAYKISAECIKIQIIAEKKQGAGNSRRNCTGRKKNEAALPQICI